MAKTTVFLLLLVLTGTVIAQDWEYYFIEEDPEYKHQYWFSFDNKEDTCTINIQEDGSTQEKSTVSGVILTSSGDTLPLANVILISTDAYL